jgi:hypothetical protein
VRRLVVALLLALAATPASADVPWADGVSKAKQTQANALFAEGNQLFAQQAHALALERYAAAVALWDHPLIQFNMAVTLIRLDRILEAAETIDKALRFGAAPFPSPEQYQQALDYQKLVSGRVGSVEASCQQAGASVLFDGKPWFACPGKQAKRVLAGAHVLVAEADGFMTISRRLVVSGNETAHESLALLPLDAVALHYPTPRWIPWTTAGAGAAIGLGGLGLWFAGNSAMERFEAHFKEECPQGCSANLDANETERDLARQRDSASTQGNVGLAMLVGGTAIAAGGVVWAVVFNQPSRVLPTVEVTPTSVGAGASVRF